MRVSTSSLFHQRACRNSPPTRLANSCQEGWRVGISRSFSERDAIEFILFSCQDSRPYPTDSNASAEEALSQVEIAWTEYEANSSGR